MIAVRADLSGAATFDEALRVVRAAALGAQDHQEVPFEVVVGAVNPPRLPGLNPIFQAGFSTEEPGRRGRSPAWSRSRPRWTPPNTASSSTSTWTRPP